MPLRVRPLPNRHHRTRPRNDLLSQHETTYVALRSSLIAAQKSSPVRSSTPICSSFHDPFPTWRRTSEVIVLIHKVEAHPKTCDMGAPLASQKLHQHQQRYCTVRSTNRPFSRKVILLVLSSFSPSSSESLSALDAYEIAQGSLSLSFPSLPHHRNTHSLD